MAESNYPCSISQAFNFQKDEQLRVGHLVSLSIGGTAFTADMTLTNPTDYSTGVKVVAPISHISWNGGYADPVFITFNVSTENQKTASIMQHTNLSDTTVVFEYNIYDFDTVAKKYYLAFHTNASTLNGYVMKQGGRLALDIDSAADGEVVSPMNYVMQLGIMPQESQQAIQLAVSNSDKFAKQWGVTVGGS